jgi:hypothetical protein
MLLFLKTLFFKEEIAKNVKKKKKKFSKDIAKLEK